MSSYSQQNRNNLRIIANHQIRADQLRVLDEQNKSIGVISLREALTQANEQKKDLVLITAQANPPVAKIIELSKFKYQQQRKLAKARKKNRTQDLKEVRLSMFMGDGDLQSKKRKIKQFLKDGDKVRLNLLFKGREVTKKEFAYELFNQVINEVLEEKIGTVETQPKIIGKKLMAQITPV